MMPAGGAERWEVLEKIGAYAAGELALLSSNIAAGRYVQDGTRVGT